MPQCHRLSTLCWKLVCSCLSTTDFPEVLLSRIQAPFHKAGLWHTTLPLAILKTWCVWMCLQSKLWELHYHLLFCWQLLSVSCFFFTSAVMMKAFHSIGISANTHWNQSKGLFSCQLAIFFFKPISYWPLLLLNKMLYKIKHILYQPHSHIGQLYLC